MVQVKTIILVLVIMNPHSLYLGVVTLYPKTIQVCNAEQKILARLPLIVSTRCDI